MSISFTCTNCARRYDVSESLAGKRARCKDCGVEFRVPTPDPTPTASPKLPPTRTLAPPTPARKPAPPARPQKELYGFDDPPAPKRPLYEIEDDEPVLPKRAPATWRPRERDSTSASGSGEELANKFCFKGFAVFVAGVVLFEMPKYGYVLAHRGQGLDPALQMIVGAIIAGLGILAILGGLVLAFVDYLRYQELPSVGIGGGIVWALSLLSVLIFGIGFVNGFNDQQQRQQVVRNEPNTPPARPGQRQGFVPPGVTPPPRFTPPPQFTPPQSDVHVVLSNGQVTRRTIGFGATVNGIEIRVDYNIDGGHEMGEKYVLMIKSRKSQAKLTTRHLNGSGTLSGSNFIGSIDDGPFEAWMELESFGSRNSRRVSDTITLQVTEPPPATQPNLGPRGMPNSNGLPPGARPGMPPGFPGPIGPPPRSNRGPRGFPGSRP